MEYVLSSSAKEPKLALLSLSTILSFANDTTVIFDIPSTLPSFLRFLPTDMHDRLLDLISKLL